MDWAGLGRTGLDYVGGGKQKDMSMSYSEAQHSICAPGSEMAQMNFDPHREMKL